MQVAIIAGGLATRLGQLTKNLPKSLITIKGKPFIEYQLESLRRGGIRDIVMCLGHFGEQVEDCCGNGRRYGVRIRYSYETKRLDTAGALKLAELLLDDTFFALYGDSYVFLDFKGMLSAFQRENKQAMMSVYKNQDKYDKSNTNLKNGMVIEYSKETNTGMNYIDYGVNIFRKEVLKMIPPGQPYSMTSVFNQLIINNELLAYEVKRRFYEIGSIEGLREFTKYVQRN